MFFAQLTLDLEGKQNLLKFSGVRFFGAEEKIPRHLHGDGARTLPGALGAQIVQGGAQDAEKIHAMVVEEGTIFRREKCLDEQIRHFAESHRYAFLLAELGNQLSVSGVNPHWHFQLCAR